MSNRNASSRQVIKPEALKIDGLKGGGAKKEEADTTTSASPLHEQIYPLEIRESSKLGKLEH